nr:FG-GAP-like repeat-containing protein [Roseococcus sp. MDT2-1-1]
MVAQGINKIVLLSHLQQYANELQLASLISGVDIIVSAGSHAIFADGDDALRPGDTPSEGYPVFRTAADGKPVAVVSTSGEYSYVGRLVLDFDANGVIIPGAVDTALNGAIATTDENVAALWGECDAYGEGTRGGEVKKITDAIQAVIETKDGNVFGFTDVFLEGRRNEVRTEETNLGNLSADANLFVARQVDAGVMVSLKNGGGIRAEIGAVLGQPIPEELPPLENPAAGKPAGGVSQLDIENSLRFNNTLSIVSVTAANFERLFEHAVAGWTSTATPGQFAQVGGVSFSFDPARAAQAVSGGAVTTEGERIRNLAILNEDGSVADVIMQDGVLVGDPGRVIKLVTLSFLADGGDSYPLPGFIIPGSRVDLQNNAALSDGAASFAVKGTEQDALAEYMVALHGTQSSAYEEADAGPQADLRVQNLDFRDDTALRPWAQITPDGSYARLVQFDASMSVRGGERGEAIQGHAAAEAIFGEGGNDTLIGRGGDDLLDGGRGFDTAVFAGNRADAVITNLFDGRLQVQTSGGTALVTGVEALRFDDGALNLQPRRGDMTGDLSADLVFLNGNGVIGLWTMDGSTVDDAAVIGWAQPGAWRFRFSGDMTGDGRADLLFNSAAGNNLWLLKSDGTGMVSASWRQGPTGLTLVAQGDLDGDGDADLVWQGADGGVTAWRMDGNGLAPAASVFVGHAPGQTVLASADVTGDANADIVLRDEADGIWVWEMDWTTRLSATQAGTVEGRFALAGMADLDGDGRSGFVWQDDATGDVTLWEWGTEGVESTTLAFGPSWRVAQVADLSGDGRADLVLRHETGALGLWEMDGFALKAATMIGGPGSEWTLLG